MLCSRKWIAAALVIYAIFIDHLYCQSIGKIHDSVAHLRGNGVRTTVNGVEKRSTWGTSGPVRVTRQISEDQDDDNDNGSLPYRHYAASSDDDNQYRDHDYDSTSDDDGFAEEYQRRGGVTGPVHTYIKTDKNANFKWGVRHFAGKQYRGGRRWP
ncbi:uncharacterized protein LOC134211424 isoform X2 [Armigeres subalbatus]|uniref:uncharacterized protein LOC134211424 isoform X2 n=1 Tax=Armigeres subalbatus TaxID=124917 RepID=UPI002ED44DD7